MTRIRGIKVGQRETASEVMTPERRRKLLELSRLKSWKRTVKDETLDLPAGREEESRGAGG